MGNSTIASSLQAPARTAERGTQNQDPRRSTTSQLRSPLEYHTILVLFVADATFLATVAAAVTVVLPPRLIAAAAPSVAAPAAAWGCMCMPYPVLFTTPFYV